MDPHSLSDSCSDSTSIHTKLIRSPLETGASFVAFSDYHTPIEIGRFWCAAIGALALTNAACVFDTQASYGKRAVSLGMTAYHVAITYLMVQRVQHFPAVGGVQQEYMAHVGACGIHALMGVLNTYWLLTSRAPAKNKLL